MIHAFIGTLAVLSLYVTVNLESVEDPKVIIPMFFNVIFIWYIMTWSKRK